jgi:hypothetical protein
MPREGAAFNPLPLEVGSRQTCRHARFGRLLRGCGRVRRRCIPGGAGLWDRFPKRAYKGPAAWTLAPFNEVPWVLASQGAGEFEKGRGTGEARFFDHPKRHTEEGGLKACGESGAHAEAKSGSEWRTARGPRPCEGNPLRGLRRQEKSLRPPGRGPAPDESAGLRAPDAPGADHES